jgi:hypothetical protein
VKGWLVTARGRQFTPETGGAGRERFADGGDAGQPSVPNPYWAYGQT